MRLLLTICCLLLAVSSALAQKNLQLRSVLTYTDPLNDLWGFTDSSGNEYALVGLETGVSVVDISNPDSIFEIFFIPGDTSVWRDIKTWQSFAYVTNETDGGLMIIDLRFIPDSISYSNYTGGLLKIKSAHNLFIDENGIAYLFGSNKQNGGCIALDLSAPENPSFLGIYDENYVHDGFIRGDTMYSAEIYEGEFAVIDFSDKSNPLVIARQSTPSRFTHNCWLSDDNKFLFATDEIKNAPISSFDISDVNNIKKLDEYRSSPGDSVIPHNVHFIDDFLVNSYYRDGVTIVDVHKPYNMVEVGFYDTNPLASASGFQGCWGVYPYLPSGNIIASDRSEGLFVLTPSYQRACYLEGKTNDMNSGLGAFDVRVEIIGTDIREKSDISGQYATGVSDSGSYDVRFSRQGCTSLIVTDVDLNYGQTTILDVSLDCILLSSQNPDLSGISVYPALFSDHLKILVETNNRLDEDSYVNIFNVDGRKVLQYPLISEISTINGLNFLPNGSYLVQIKLANHVTNFRVMKH